MMNVAERKQANAPTEAQRWLASFELPPCRQATCTQQRGCSTPTVSGATCWPSPGRPDDESEAAAIAATLRETLDARTAAAKPAYSGETERRRAGSPSAGTEAIEALFEFETAFGRGAGVVRLTPRLRGLRAWTIVTTLEELRGRRRRLQSQREPGDGDARFRRARTGPTG